jgi:hypothetical protein
MPIKETLVHVIPALGQNDVIVPLFAKRGGQVYVQFVGLAAGACGIGVVPHGVARLDPLNQSGEFTIQVRHVGHVKNLSTSLVGHFANVD